MMKAGADAFERLGFNVNDCIESRPIQGLHRPRWVV